MIIFLVVNNPSHERCEVAHLVETIGVFSTARGAWDHCVKLGAHGIGYWGMEVDRAYRPDEVVDAIFPNCPKEDHKRPEEASAPVGR